MASILEQIMNYNESDDMKLDDKEPTPHAPGKSGSSDSDMEESAMLTEQELSYIYSECVAEVIRESKASIDKKYKEKKKLAKSMKAKKLAKKKIADKKKDKELALKEAADPNMVINQIFDAF